MQTYYDPRSPQTILCFSALKALQHRLNYEKIFYIFFYVAHKQQLWMAKYFQPHFIFTDFHFLFLCYTQPSAMTQINFNRKINEKKNMQKIFIIYRILYNVYGKKDLKSFVSAQIHAHRHNHIHDQQYSQNLKWTCV